MMFQTLVECTAGLDDILKSHASLQDAMDVKEVISRFTTDVIGSCAFGIDCNSLKNPDSEFRQFGRKIFTSSFWRRIRTIFAILVSDKIILVIEFNDNNKYCYIFFP